MKQKLEWIIRTRINQAIVNCTNGQQPVGELDFKNIDKAVDAAVMEILELIDSELKP